VQAQELWRIEPRYLEQAQDDATLLAIRDMERAGVDIISDGEIRRESYSNRLANALAGIDTENPGTALDRTGHPNPVPRISGAIRRERPVEVRDLEFLRANTDRAVKITLPGPFTMAQQAQNDFYPDERQAALAYADAVNQEIRDLFAAGADIVQLDEPYMAARPEKAREFGVEALDHALTGIGGTTAVHLCFGYAAIVHNRGNVYEFLEELAVSKVGQVSIEAAQPNLDLSVLTRLGEKTVILGVLNLGDMTVETPQTVGDRIRAAVRLLPPNRLVIAPDCGMKYLPRDVAFAKLAAMVEGTQAVRKELTGR
jgi:5-methyltetrahydropteroyltriglutamate--homocysteine methyltransferase